jgi:phosphohistidine swiveling domain-containing protein
MTTATATTKLVYFFGEGQAEASSDLKHLVGGKGASLADMTKAQLNVPPGFTISTECCDLYYKAGKQWPSGLEDTVRESLARLEKLAGRSLGQGDNPLLVAVRSGAAQSMPGMMDTVLNVGLNPDCVRQMATRTGNPRASWEAYRHFIVMFGHTVGGVEEAVFSQLLAETLKQTGKSAESDLDAGQMEQLCQRSLEAYRQRAGKELPTEPWEMLRQAIDAVFGSWNNERAILYRQHHNVKDLLGTAVNVQMMCPSEVSGVMFTANPVNPALEQIIIESSFGLGEAVVLGKVTPDKFVLDKKTLQIAERTINIKHHVVATLAADGQGQTGTKESASLRDEQIAELARLGLRVEAYFKVPSDIEWALSAGKFYLLQARAIKAGKTASGLAGTNAEREQVRKEEIAALRAKAQPTGTVWARYNLAEILPTPTPMTWSIIKGFMSGKGGFGLMYRDLGFDPDPIVDDEGIYDLVCGRPYCNLSREPKMQFRQIPFEHPFPVLKAAPQKAVYPQPSLTPSWKYLLLLPIITWKLFRSASLMKHAADTSADKLRQDILPKFGKETAEEAQRDLTKLDEPALLERLKYWVQRTLYDFARDSLKPTALAAVCMGNIERGLARAQMTPEKVRSAVGQLVMGVRPDPEADLPGAVSDLSAGRLDRAEFLVRFGHRGPQEMELSRPRWGEDSSALDQLTKQGTFAAGFGGPPISSNRETTSFRQRIAAEVRKTLQQQPGLEQEVAQLHTYLALRETSKHYLMKGCAQIRRYLLELDRRHSLQGGIFYLTPDELPKLIKGEDLTGRIAQRKKRREIALSLEAPQVIFSDDLEAIGREMSLTNAQTLTGVPLSAGLAEAPALVLSEPSGAAIPEEPYILVAPTTDPAWVPLFVHARGLVMETGGVLSHGAIVAREFGLPAVAGLPDIHRRLKTGQRLRIDGGTGKVTLLNV